MEGKKPGGKKPFLHLLPCYEMRISKLAACIHTDVIITDWLHLRNVPSLALCGARSPTRRCNLLKQGQNPEYRAVHCSHVCYYAYAAQFTMKNSHQANRDALFSKGAGASAPVSRDARACAYVVRSVYNEPGLGAHV